MTYNNEADTKTSSERTADEANAAIDGVRFGHRNQTEKAPNGTNATADNTRNAAVQPTAISEATFQKNYAHTSHGERPSSDGSVEDWVKRDLVNLYKHFPEKDSSSVFDKVADKIFINRIFANDDKDISMAHATGIIQNFAATNTEYAKELYKHRPDILKEADKDVYAKINAEQRVDTLMKKNPYALGREGIAPAAANNVAKNINQLSPGDTARPSKGMRR